MQSEALPSFSRIWELSTRVWVGFGTSVNRKRRRPRALPLGRKG